jgi:hypothetical protein
MTVRASYLLATNNHLDENDRWVPSNEQAYKIISPPPIKQERCVMTNVFIKELILYMEHQTQLIICNPIYYQIEDILL